MLPVTFPPVFLTPLWCDFDSQSLGRTADFRAKKEKKKRGQEQEEDKLFSSVQGLGWAWLGVIRVLIVLHVALHSRDISNTIQNDQNEINHESDGSSWLFKLRRNDFCRGLLIRYFLFYACVSFV